MKILKTIIFESIKILLKIPLFINLYFKSYFFIYILLFYFSILFNFYLKILLFLLNVFFEKEILNKLLKKIKSLNIKNLCFYILLFYFFKKFDFKIFYIPVLGTFVFILFLISEKIIKPNDSFKLLFVNQVLNLAKENQELLKKIKSYVNKIH